MKASRHVHELRESAEETLLSLQRVQTDLADKFQAAELEIDEVRQHRAPTDAQWREEAGAWQSAYDTAKASAGQAHQQYASIEHAVVVLDTQVRDLRRSLEESQWDLDDARAACGASEKRVSSDADRLAEAVALARTMASAEQTAAEAAHAEAVTAQARLDASCDRVAKEPARAGRVEAGTAAARLLASNRAQADAEEKRCMELESEVADRHQRVTAGRAALGRLRVLRQEASGRLETKVVHPKPSRVDASCSPLPPRGETAAEMELRARLRDWETKLRDLEDDRQQLRRLQQLDVERHAAKTERLRLKAERYRTGHADLRRLYNEQQENRH